MSTDDWIEHRRGDGELVGWMAPDGEGFVVVDLLGRPRTSAVDWLTAEETLDDLGIGYLADRYELRGDNGSWQRVRIVEVTRERVLVKRDDGGAIGGVQEFFPLPFPAPDTLRTVDPSAPNVLPW